MTGVSTRWILGIDPGTTQSAVVVLEPDGKPFRHATVWNESMVDFIRTFRVRHRDFVVAIEMVESFGMPVGAEVFETVRWIGRFEQVCIDAGLEVTLIRRGDVKMHLCGSRRAKDANIRQALVDLYGPGKDKAIGRKRTPGPLYGISGDQWSALAVAVTERAIDWACKDLQSKTGQPPGLVLIGGVGLVQLPQDETGRGGATSCAER